MDLKSSYLPPVFFKFGQQVVHFVGIPVFFFLFVILYKPFNLEHALSLRYGSFAFNVSMISSILFLVILASRFILWGLRNAASFKRRTYFVWCVGEIFVSALFVALFVHLISGKVYGFIDVVPYCIAYITAVTVFPYLIFTLVLESDIIAKYAVGPVTEPVKLKFYDERHNLKFVTEPSSILYIEADENYCIIHYTEGGKLKEFVLRSSLRKLELLCGKYGIARCHRSYLVNVSRIKVLKRDREGVFSAEMDMQHMDSIPVTARYYEQISAML